jgi:hypothetical protein
MKVLRVVECETDKEDSTIKTGATIRDTGKTIKWMELGSFTIRMEILPTKVVGLKTSSMG